LTTGPAPSALRTRPATPTPSAANAAVPSSRARTSETQRSVEHEAADPDEDRGFDREDDQERDQHRCDVRAGGKRRGADALQRAALAADDEKDREAGEGGRDRAVADHPCQQVVRAGDAAHLVVLRHRSEQQVDDHGQREREERELAAAPEQPVLRPQLVEEQPHSSGSAVSDR
jgi:hypothetical protein